MAGLPTATPEETGVSSAGLARIDAALQAVIDAGTIPGVVTIVARHGKVIHQAALGWKDIASGERADADTLFRIFSMTKPITATAMMILYDEGRWHPDDPVAKHLPEFADVKVFAGRDGDGAPVIVDAAHPPTVRELLTHTAGFSYGTALSDPNDYVDTLYREAQVWEAEDLREMMARLARLPLTYQPGAAWRYSLSMDVQGALIERLSGQSLPDFMEQRIFGPLGMIDTAFHTPPEQEHRLATLYFKAPDVALVPIGNPLKPDHQRPPSLALGGAGLVSTANDYVRYAQMLLNKGELDGQRIISREAAELQMTNQLSDAMLSAGFGAGHQKIRPGFGFGFNGVVFTDPVLAGVPVGKGSYHWDGAAGTWFWVDPANDLLFVAMTQHLSYTAPALQTLTQTLMADALTG